MWLGLIGCGGRFEHDPHVQAVHHVPARPLPRRFVLKTVGVCQHPGDNRTKCPGGDRIPSAFSALGDVAVVEEAAAGTTLRDVLLRQMREPRRRLVPQPDGLRWAHQVAHGLAELHAANVSHGDVRAGTVLITGAQRGSLS